MEAPGNMMDQLNEAEKTWKTIFAQFDHAADCNHKRA